MRGEVNAVDFSASPWSDPPAGANRADSRREARRSRHGSDSPVGGATSQYRLTGCTLLNHDQAPSSAAERRCVDDAMDYVW